MCTPTSPSWLPATGKKAEHRAPWDQPARGREWDHCHNYTIKSSSQQNHKTGLLSGVWPGWLATTCPAFFCDTVLCHFLHSDTVGRATSEGVAFAFFEAGVIIQVCLLLCAAFFLESAALLIMMVAICENREIKIHMQEATRRVMQVVHAACTQRCCCGSVLRLTRALRQLAPL